VWWQQGCPTHALHESTRQVLSDQEQVVGMEPATQDSKGRTTYHYPQMAPSRKDLMTTTPHDGLWGSDKVGASSSVLILELLNISLTAEG
jgi:hypothetical protein